MKKITSLMLILVLTLTLTMGMMTVPTYASDQSTHARGAVKLNAIEKHIYDNLLTGIKNIAAGNSSSSEISVELISKVSKTTYTASELGLSSVAGPNNSISEAAKTAVTEKALGSIDTNKILETLLLDCPYELYWFDKTSDCIQSVSTKFTGTTGGGGSVTLTSAVVTFKMPVAQDYSSAKAKNTYQVNTSMTKAAAASAAKAQSIINQAANMSDHEKLVYYKNEICRLASYNNSVASDPSKSEKYGDPYQLIYVFDGNTSTSVTCEGYSKAFKYLCDLTKFNNSTIRCYLVTGGMSGGTGAGPHMWNLVHMDNGFNYLCDITNCDAGTAGEPDQLFMVGDPNGTSSNYSKQTTAGVVAFAYGSDMNNMYTAAELTIAKSDYQSGSSSGNDAGSSIWKRLYGNGRYDTMKAIVDEGFTTTGGTVIIATGTGFKDALSASGLAGLYDAPVLLTDGKKLSTQTQTILQRLKPARVFVAGGTFVVTDSVVNEIKRVTGVTPKRLAGANSSETSAKLALEGQGRWKDQTAIIATNKSFKDALSVAPIAYAKGYPILLSDNGQSLSSAVLNALNTLGIKNVIIVGGTGAVSQNVERQLAGANISVKTRLAGSNGVETSAAIARWGIQNGLSANRMGVATSQNYPDALAGAALCGHYKSVLVLADDKAILNASFPASYKSTITRGYVFGGPSAVGHKTMDQLIKSVS